VRLNAQMSWLRWYGRLARWVHLGELHATLLWAAVVGCIGGFSAIGFRKVMEGVLWCFTQRTGSLEQVATALPWWRRFWVPIAGGLLAGLVLQLGARLRRSRRSTDYMEAVAVRRGHLSIRLSLIKTVSSLFTIGSGGSIGREGAMVQLSAMLASWLGRQGRLSTPRLRLVVACGAAGGLAAVYNVTIAGALFVAEIVLGSIAMESLGPLLVAAVTSSVVSRYFLGAEPYFISPRFELVSGWELIPYLVMGGVLGMAAPGYVRLLRLSEDGFTWLVPRAYWRMALGGLVVGCLAIPFPETWGNGRTMVNLALQNSWPWALLLAILVCKVVATAATTGSGAVGGVFTPTLFTGAMLGCLFGHLAQAVWPGPIAGAQAYGLVGMAGFLAATTRAPLMAILMLFEMTLDYGIVLPLMLVCVVAYHTARSLQSDSIYSEALRRKQPHTTPAEVSGLRVRALMKPPPVTVQENTPLAQVVELFARAPYRYLPVVALQNQLRGLIALGDLEDWLRRGQPGQWVTAASLMRAGPPMVTPETTLADALELFRSHPGERLPVVDNLTDRLLLGYVSKTDLLLTLAHGLKGGPLKTA
jgi:chloride channel protein, CIC family